MQLTIHQFDLQLAHPFTTSHGMRTVQPTLIVQLQVGAHFGLGEAAATSYYGLTIDQMVSEVEAKRTEIEAFDSFTTPEEFHSIIQTWFPDHTFIQCAFDLAAHDLYGKMKSQPLYELWGTSIERIPISNYTIGIDQISIMKEKMIAHPWPIYKIKLGTSEDKKIISELRSVSDSTFRVDANCGWTAQETIENAIWLKKAGVEFIEQPMPPNQNEEMFTVKEHSVLPIIADESCQTEEDIERCATYFDGVNIKLTKCGGLTPARRMIQKAKSLGLSTMVGCMTESSVGISAIAHLLPQLDYVDMDGSLLLKDEPAEGVYLGSDGRAVFPNRPGTGALLKSTSVSSKLYI